MQTSLAGFTYHLITFGCQMNKHDSERVAGMLDALGALEVDSVEASDICIFLTCCVREAADVRLYGQVSSYKNTPLREGSPLSSRIIAIGGCIGQRDGRELTEKLPNVSIVFGTHNLASLPHLLFSVIETGTSTVEILEENQTPTSDYVEKREKPWSAWLPIMTGCNNFCTYCIVPYVRGREKSLAFESVISKAEELIAQGVSEITLLGQNVNSYGRDVYGEPRFAELLREIDKLGLKRLRFATSHPKDISPDVIQAFGELPTLMPALHLPAQSGSNRILKQMNRRYTVEKYLDIISQLRKACPSIALSSDIIVGFPGETEEDFQATYDLVKQVGYNQVFTFIYSKRAGTPAADMPDDTPRDVIQERFERLVNLVQEKAYEANQVDLGTETELLIEGVSKRNSAILSARTPKNQTAHAPLPLGACLDDLLGTYVPAKITEAKTWYLNAEILPH